MPGRVGFRSSSVTPEGQASPGQLPGWLKIAFSLFLCVLVPVYWHHHGPANFLWGSDIALFLVLLSLWRERPLPNSMMAISVLPFEIAWCVDFVAGSRLFGMAAYMFDPGLPLYLRSLSLFHIALPVLIVFLLRRLGYDRRALVAQTALAWMVLPATFLLTDPAENINRVFGLGEAPQTWLPPVAYLVLQMLVLTLAVFWPMHLLLRRLCRNPRPA